MFLIAGLGNPEKKYDYTRHNLGFHTIDHLIQQTNFKATNHTTTTLTFNKKFKAYMQEVTVTTSNDKPIKLIFAKPTTYMNLSGEAVLRLQQFYKIKGENTVVLVDDYYLPFGKIRLRLGGSAGGHNGLKSIMNAIGDNFIRLRCGIAQSEQADSFDIPINDFVLGKFSPEEKSLLIAYYQLIEKCLICLLEKGLAKTLNLYNNQCLTST